jgi:hypothetical protein
LAIYRQLKNENVAEVVQGLIAEKERDNYSQQSAERSQEFEIDQKLREIVKTMLVKREGETQADHEDRMLQILKETIESEKKKIK